MKILESIHSTLISILDELKAIKEQDINVNITATGSHTISKKELLSGIKHTPRQYGTNPVN